MNRPAHATDRYRLSGLLLAAAGICINQTVAPKFEVAQPFIALAGVLVAVSGLLVIAVGVRRRLGRTESTAANVRSALLPSP